MNNRTSNHTSIQPQAQRLLKMIGTLLIAVSIALVIFLGRNHRAPSFISPTADVSTSITQENFQADTLIAYSVDYEMDKARVEKTIEHYEGMEPIVEQAIKNNEENPDSKPTAENSYQRESELNELLPESMGEEFSKEELSNMEK